MVIGNWWVNQFLAKIGLRVRCLSFKLRKYEQVYGESVWSLALNSSFVWVCQGIKVWKPSLFSPFNLICTFLVPWLLFWKLPPAETDLRSPLSAAVRQKMKNQVASGWSSRKQGETWQEVCRTCVFVSPSARLSYYTKVQHQRLTRQWLHLQDRDFCWWGRDWDQDFLKTSARNVKDFCKLRDIS